MSFTTKSNLTQHKHMHIGDERCESGHAEIKVTDATKEYI